MGQFRNVGKIEKEIRTSASQAAVRIVISIVLGLGAVLYARFDSDSLVFAVGCAVVLAAFIVWDLVSICRRRRFTMIIGSRGFEFGSNPFAPDGCDWDDIVETRRDFRWFSSNVKTGSFVIRTREQREFVFSAGDFEDTSYDLFQFADEVESRVHDRMFRQALDAWNAGTDTRFAGWCVGPSGVGEVGSPIAWSELSVARFDTPDTAQNESEHRLTLRREGNLLINQVIASCDTPNWKVFRALVEHGRKMHPPAISLQTN